MGYIKKVYPYIIYITLILIIISYGVYFVRSSSIKHLNVVMADTNAKIYDINSKLYALPKPQTIKPQSTSGVLAGQLTGYETFVKQLNELKFTNVSLAEFVFVSSKAGQTKNIQNKVLEVNKQLKKEADEYRFALMASKKLLEYNPSVDLKEFKLDNPDTNERLDKTIAGIKSTSDDLYKQNSKLAKKLNGYSSELYKPYEQLKSGGDLAKWNAEVLRVQKLILKEIEPVQAKIVKDYSQKLFDILTK